MFLQGIGVLVETTNGNPILSDRLARSIDIPYSSANEFPQQHPLFELSVKFYWIVVQCTTSSPS